MYIVGISSISATLDKQIVFCRFAKIFRGQGTQNADPEIVEAKFS